jgi:hypothetical protein
MVKDSSFIVINLLKSKVIQAVQLYATLSLGAFPSIISFI